MDRLPALCAAAALALAFPAGAQPVFTIRSGDALGLIDRSGKVVLAPEFSEVKPGNPLILASKGHRTAFFDYGGRTVIEARFDTAEDFSDGLALVKEGGRSVFVDKQGRVVLQPEAEQVYPFAEGLAVARVGQKYGYIDKRGKFAIEPQFSFARAFRDGLASVSMGRASGYIKPDGRFVWRDDGPPRN